MKNLTRKIRTKFQNFANCCDFGNFVTISLMPKSDFSTWLWDIPEQLNQRKWNGFPDFSLSYDVNYSDRREFEFTSCVHGCENNNTKESEIAVLMGNFEASLTACPLIASWDTARGIWRNIFRSKSIVSRASRYVRGLMLKSTLLRFPREHSILPGGRSLRKQPSRVPIIGIRRYWPRLWIQMLD